MNKKTIIVTGASRGLGAAAARIAAELGAIVVLNARSAGDLEQVARSIQEAGGRALAVAGDVSQIDECRQLVARTIAAFGRIDALVNNAGVLDPIATIADSDPAAWQKNVAVNVLAPMVLTQSALPYLRESNGRVINVSSGAAVNPVRGWSAYCAAKAALNQFNAVLAKEETDVTAIAFRPGVVDTEMQTLIRREGATGMTVADHARFQRYHAEGQLLPPEQPGRALAILALHAPHEWSGRFLSWDDEEVQAVVQKLHDA